MPRLKMRKWEKKGRKAQGAGLTAREVTEVGSRNVEAEGIAHGAKEKKKVRGWEDEKTPAIQPTITFNLYPLSFHLPS
jgi:hypothetical protein